MTERSNESGAEPPGATERMEAVHERYGRSRRKRRIWDADNQGNFAARSELSTRIREAAGKRLPTGQVLDVGCGGGWLLLELERAGVAQEHLHGVEVLAERIADARGALPRADIRRADAAQLPYDADSFDVVAFVTVLHLLPDADAVEAALEEGRRVLAPGGALIVYEPRLPNPLNRATRLIGARELDRGLGSNWQDVPLTVIPQVARVLGPLAARAYPRLARVRPLLSHRLAVFVDPRERVTAGESRLG